MATTIDTELDSVLELMQALHTIKPVASKVQVLSISKKTTTNSALFSQHQKLRKKTIASLSAT